MNDSMIRVLIFLTIITFWFYTIIFMTLYVYFKIQMYKLNKENEKLEKEVKKVRDRNFIYEMTLNQIEFKAKK